MRHDDLSRERLKELLDYNPRTGIWRWKVDRGAARKGDVAGNENENGYLTVMLDYRRYRLHRLAFLFMRGFIPPEVDHKNRVKSDNRWRNLKASPRGANCQNKAPRGDVKFKGVCKHRKRYRAAITVNYKMYRTRTFSTAVEAAYAYDSLAIKYFGPGACTNLSLGLY